MRSIINFIKRNRVAVKLLSLFLSLLLIFYVIPSNIYSLVAEALTTNEENTVSEAATKNSAEESERRFLSNSFYEDESLREEYVKHFHLPDGTYVAAQYNSPVHYTDENGVWQDINNSLLDTGNEFENSNARIKFAKKITGNDTLFALHDGSTKLTLSLTGANKGTVGAVTNNSDAAEDNELQKMMNLENLSSRVLYADILDGVDIEYVASSMNIKENIIVKERKDSYSYEFELKLNGLTASLAANGDILVTDDDGNLKYTIPAPVIFDASGNYAPKDKSHYTLNHKSGKKYTLTVIVDSDWMNAEERVFPVTVDPAVISANTSLTDAYIAADRPDFGGFNATNLFVSDTNYAYIRSASLPTIPSSAYISNATVTMRKSLAQSDTYVAVYEVISDWDTTLSWNTYSNAESPMGEIGEDILDYCLINSDEQIYTWDITSLAKRWYSGNNNYGVAFKSFSSGTNLVFFYSSNHSEVDISYRPALTIEYRDMNGIEGYWSYSSHSAGIAGSGSLNLANGNLSFAIPTLTTTDGLFGYTPALYYNSALSGKDYIYSNAKTAYSASYTPYGFKLSINESIIEESYNKSINETDTYFIHADADGTEHAYYVSANEDETDIYYDEDALGKTMTVNTDTIEITDDSHIIRRFSKMASTPSSSVLSAWYLTEIEDAAGNRLKFEFNSSYQPTKIQLCPTGSSDIEMLRFLYVDNKLAAVYNNSSKDSVILTYNGEYLEAVKYCYGNTDTFEQNVIDVCEGLESASNVTQYATATYTYDSSGRLTAITDSDTGKSIHYEISCGRITKISEYAEDLKGQEVSYIYGEKYTDVRATGNDEILETADDIITRYIFDSCGRAVSMYSASSDGKEIYGATMGVYDTQENSKNSLKETTVLGKINANLLKNGDFQQYRYLLETARIMSWTHSSNVTKNKTTDIGAVQPDSISLSPTVGCDAYIYQDCTLEAGDYILTVNHASANCTGIEGYAQILDASNSSVIKSIKLDLSNGAKETSYDTLAFSLESAKTVTVKFLFNATSIPGSSASISLGMAKLEEGKTATDYNLVSNSAFDSGATTNWSASDNTTISVETDSETSDKYLKIIANGVNSSYAVQTVYQAGTLTTTEDSDLILLPEGNPYYQFSVSGFAKAENAFSNKPFRLRATIVYCGANGETITTNHYYDFNPDCTDWQFVSGTFTLDKYPDGTDLPTYLYVSSVSVYCEFSEQLSGYALFDDISISYVGVALSQKTAYNSDGRPAIVKDGFYKKYYEYNENGNISRVANNRGELTDYVYSEDNQHLLLSTTDYDYSYNGNTYEYPYYEENIDDIIVKTRKFRTVYEYNQYNLLLHTLLQSPVEGTEDEWENVSQYSSTYVISNSSKIFGTKLSETGSDNNKIYYFRDQNKGYLLATIDLNSGTGYSYDYDSRGRLIGVYPATYTQNSGSFTTVSNAENVSYTYDGLNRLSKINTAKTEYTFSYDTYGNTSKIEAGANTLAEYSYNPNNGKLNRITYGNSFYVEYVYNELEQLAEIKHNGVTKYSYEYTSDGQLRSFTDVPSGRTTVYIYDVNKKFIGSREYAIGSEGNIFETNISYNSLGYTTSINYAYTYLLSGALKSANSGYYYTYRDDGTVKSESISAGGGNIGISYSYDALDRISSILYNGNTGAFNNTVTYTYKTTDRGETGLVENYTSTVGSTATSYTYTYDSKGNITQITDSSGKYVAYTYDDIGQLKTEYNQFMNRQYRYSYDNAGNITSVWSDTLSGSSGDLTPINGIDTGASTLALPISGTLISYSYSDSEWGDPLISYKGNQITYDEIGNPIGYYNGMSYTFTWEGRRLVGATKGSNAYSFTYNDEGLRTSKTVNGVTTNYYYDGSLLIKEETPSYTIVYIYDISGTPISFRYRASSYAEDTWDVYYYERNLQGDIIAIYNASGTKLVTYNYNAWGNMTASYTNGGLTTAVTKNPLRYRGYYYDSETGLYYVSSRYYDSEIGRWINGDSVIAGVGSSIQGYNMFAYCFNNPVNMTDNSGTWPSWNDIKAGFKKAADWVDNSIIQPVVDFVEDVVEDFYNYDSNNQSEDVVFSSNYFSNYNGMLVVKTPFDSSFSFGFIGLSTQQQNTNTLKHEYGHTVQMKNMGIGSYITDVAVPSITINILDRKGKLPYDYYSYPWEAEANKLGGAPLSQSWKPPLPQGGYTSYWDLIQLFFK